MFGEFLAFKATIRNGNLLLPSIADHIVSTQQRAQLKANFNPIHRNNIIFIQY